MFLTVITKENVIMSAITLVSSEEAPSQGPALSPTLKFHELQLVQCVFLCASEAVLTPEVTEGYRPGFHHLSFGDIPWSLLFECIGFPSPSGSPTNPLSHVHMGVAGWSLPLLALSKISKGSQTEIKKPNQKKIDQP